MVNKCKQCDTTITSFRGYHPEHGHICIDCYKQLMTETTPTPKTPYTK